MAERVHHCPFLNRADSRCASNFSLGRLGEALDHCFDRYGTCEVYADLLLERQVRRAEAAALLGAADGDRRPADGRHLGDRPTFPHGAHHGTPLAQFVQVTISHRDAQHAAADAGVPAAPGL